MLAMRRICSMMRAAAAKLYCSPSQIEAGSEKYKLKYQCTPKI
jgi:hypothetical protein